MFVQLKSATAPLDELWWYRCRWSTIVGELRVSLIVGMMFTLVLDRYGTVRDVCGKTYHSYLYSIDVQVPQTVPLYEYATAVSSSGIKL